eukprot:270664_1
MSGKAPPCKKIRIDPNTATVSDSEGKQIITTLSDDLLIFILSFFSYQTIIISLSKTCKFFNKLIDNNPISCIKHFHFGTHEHSIDSNKLFKLISSWKKHQKGENCLQQYHHINRFLYRFSRVESLELMTIDQTMTLMDPRTRIDPTVIQFYIQYFLKPLQNKLIKLIVNTWDDGALSVNSFNFGNITFNNARAVQINGKDTQYPFHVTEYTPNVERLALDGCSVMFYSFYRMMFDTQYSLKHLSQLHIFGCSFIDKLCFYQSRLNRLHHQNKVKIYNLNELEMNQSGGTLLIFDFMIKHGFYCYQKELTMMRLVVLYNKNTLQDLRVNYCVFCKEISLDDVPQINGLKIFVDRTNEKAIYLPNLEHLSLTISRIAASKYRRIHEDILFYSLAAPKLHSIELIPGGSCWHDQSGFIPFLEVLIGDQLYNLNRITIKLNGQRDYTQSAIDRLSSIYEQKNSKINIILQ